MRYVGERTGWGDGMEEMVHLIPDGIAHFGKRVTTIDEPETKDGKLVIHFDDGTSAETDAIAAICKEMAT